MKYKRQIQSTLLYLSEPRTIRRAIVLFVNLGTVIGGPLIIKSGRSRFMGMYLGILLAVLLVDIILYTTSQETNPVAETQWLQMFSDPRSSVSILLIAVSIGAVFDLGTASYVLFSVAVLSALYNLTNPKRTSFKPLLLVVGVSSSVMLLQLVTTNIYAPADTLHHAFNARAVAEAGTIQAIDPNSIYQIFPIVHLLLASEALVMDMHPLQMGQIVLIILYQVASIFAYYYYRSLDFFSATKSEHFIAAVIILLSPLFFHYAVTIHAQSISVVLFFMILYLLHSNVGDRRFTILLTLVSSVWVMSHHGSAMMGLAFVSFAFVSVHLSYKDNKNPYIYRFLLLGVIAFTYWAVITLAINKPFAWLTAGSPAASGGSVGQSNLAVESADGIYSLIVSGVPILIRNVHYFVVVAFAGVGLLKMVDRGLSLKLAFLFAALPAAFFFPNPAWLVLRGTTDVVRWGVVALPFIALFAGVGLNTTIRSMRDSKMEPVFGVLVSVLLVLLIASGPTDPSLADELGKDEQFSREITQDEIQSIKYVKKYRGGQYVTASQLEGKFLHNNIRYEELVNKQKQTSQTGITRIRVGPDSELIFFSGLSIFPVDDYKNDIIRVYFPSQEGDLLFATTVTGSEVDWTRSKQIVVYSNGDTIIQHKK